MKVTLISKDLGLFTLCRETLLELPGYDWELIPVAEAGEGPAGSDLYIWDLAQATQLPEAVPNRPGRYLFLLPRGRWKAFREKVWPVEVNILLHPVTRAMLRAFLEEAVNGGHLGGTHGSRLDSLRADRSEMLQCLIHANLKLQEYDHDRTNFLARALHDFRAPLTALTGYCGLLLSEQIGRLGEDQKEVLQRMQHSARRLSRMATAMFQLSVNRQLESKPKLENADIRECIDQAAHELMPYAAEKRLAVSVDAKASPEPLYFECSQIEQVLINLLDNASKFTPKFGSIDVRGYPCFWERRAVAVRGGNAGLDRRIAESFAPNAYRVDIQDTGPGIPAENLDRIFEEYTSYSGGQDRSGAGLGLAICKMILHQHRGRVWAENSRTGAVFSFVLPFRRGEMQTWVERDLFKAAVHSGVA